jgi:hypothetical protein
VNYEETFAAVAWIRSICLVLALAAQLDWEIDHVDVVGAYLDCELDEEIYMLLQVLSQKGRALERLYACLEHSTDLNRLEGHCGRSSLKS